MKVFKMDEFIILFAEAIEREEKVNQNDDFRQYEEWDSLTVFSVLAMISDSYDITLTRQKLDETKTVAGIFNLIKSEQK